VVIISGRKHDTLEEWFSKLPIDMIAEHGTWTKKHEEDWVKISGLDNQWKQDIAPILETYVDRTPGSFIEEKSYSLVWHYRKVEEGLGDLRANEIMNDLLFTIADKGFKCFWEVRLLRLKTSRLTKEKWLLNGLKVKTMIISWL
jgi:trehalose 6-phosphate synthase/phosphatase